jgi:hypothetical protein
MRKHKDNVLKRIQEKETMQNFANKTGTTWTAQYFGKETEKKAV